LKDSRLERLLKIMNRRSKAHAEEETDDTPTKGIKRGRTQR
jgi:hypothetical protein